MASNGQDDEDMISGINMTPMVDVVLVLLVIFMVTATYIANPSIMVKLPKASQVDEASQSQQLSFTLTRDGNFMLNGKAFLWDQVDQVLSEKLSTLGSQEVQAMIAADEQVSHGLVVRLIDKIRKAGITDFALSVDAQP